MRATLFCLLLAALPLAVLPLVALADEAKLEHTDAFRNAYAASFYEFDACGDGIAGRTYRNALVDKLRQCPFSADAKRRFQLWSAAQRRQSSAMMAKMIEDHGGMPMRLDGMTRSCHEQMDSAEYRAVRRRLDDYAAARVDRDAVVPQACDAAEIMP